jgi:D-alanine-D-alanine ligase
MKIGLSYDLKETVALKDEHPDDALEEYDSRETVDGLKTAIEALGHMVVKLGGGREFLNTVLKEKVDFVFNISEGLGNYRGREAQVPSVLEMLDIPYSGADPQCLAVCLDKNLTKKIVSWENIPTPRWVILEGQDQLKGTDWNSLPYPAFIKPIWEGSSKGIRQNSLVREPADIASRATEILARYQQPVLIEEFIPGDEITVGISGNTPPKVVGIMRVVPRERDINFVYSLEIKRNWEKLVDYECPAKLDKDILRYIEEFALKAFKVLECRDFARVDFRVSPQGIPYFLEINPLAGLNPHSSDLCIMGRLTGVAYNELIAGILSAALKRYPQCNRQ